MNDAPKSSHQFEQEQSRIMEREEKDSHAERVRDYQPDVMSETTQKQDLLPCPFCGRKPTIDFKPLFYSIYCTSGSCPAPSTGSHVAPEQAFKLWNTRATSSLQSRVERLEKVIKYFVDSAEWLLPQEIIDAAFRVDWTMDDGCDLAYEEMLPLQEHGLICDLALTTPSRRGPKPNDYTFAVTAKLEMLRYARIQKEALAECQSERGKS